MKKKKEPILIQYIKDRVLNKNKNFLMIFIGETGSGKSYSALRLAEQLDPTFNINRCCFKARQFMRKVNELVKRSENGEDISGTVLLWDELGTEHNAREFMTISNRVINYFFQTCRHLNLIVLMTVPFLSFVDAATRKLAHSTGEVEGITYSRNTTRVKIKMLQTNPQTGKVYPKYLRYIKNGSQYVMKKCNFKLPSKDIRTAYEKKKKKYTTALNKEIEKTLEKIEEDEEEPDRKPLTEKQEHYKEKLGKKSPKEIAKEEGISLAGVYAFKSSMEKKGYKFKPIRDGQKVIRYEIS